MVNLLEMINELKKYKSMDHEKLFRQRVAERLEQSFKSYVKDIDWSLYNLGNIKENKQINILKLINKRD